ncbi:MAG: symmetrical bis(5'-nucleosyl)-tetraphosphatase [Methylococcaceae bacterium]|nr:symmetrical bis(5'-nucleosyl)-tetraphosphatase [Methylococcaceae bacterium]
MALYAIGDVQGCYDELRRLLDHIAFAPESDRILFTGDLVNRGPLSLQTVRFVRGLGPAAVTVLGNHDLHLLAVARGVSRTKKRDTFGDILAAPDRDELLSWLQTRPLLHREGEFYLIHAGLPPQWDMAEATRRAAEVEAVLRKGEPEFFAHMYGDEPALWSDDLRGWDRLRYITSAFARTRYCDRHGRMDFKEKCEPGRQGAGLFPWFEAPNRRSRGAPIVFGHWSTLGYYAGNDCWGLDTGCLWGGDLTALRLDTQPKIRFSVSCCGHQRPHL